MLCEKCKIKQANVHTVEVINGMRHEHYLCSECAQGAAIHIPIVMQVRVSPKSQSEPEPVCECGAGISDFRQSGLMGCPQCYKTFESVLTPVIKRTQNSNTQHVGRKPHNISVRNERESLKRELKAALSDERYERAAQIRDLLRELENK